MHTITLVPGDSPANTDAVRHMLENCGAEFTFDCQEWPDGEPPSALLASAKETRAVLMGHQTSAGDCPAPIVLLRRALDAFANVRPVHGIAGINARFPNANVLIVRETTEDVYASLEHESLPGVFESLKVTTRVACERIARHAFETARALGRKTVTIVHKANIMKKSDGLFLDTAKEVAAEFPDIACEECIVDALCMKLVRDPTQFDVLLCGNLFGDIVSDLCAGLVGGAPNAPSLNYAAGGVCVYTTGHGDEPDVDGGPNTCPTSLAFSAVLLLRDLGETSSADRLMAAIEASLVSGPIPFSLGGEASAMDFAKGVVSRL